MKKSNTFTDQIIYSMRNFPEDWKLNEPAKVMFSEKMWGTHIIFAGGRLFVKITAGLKTPKINIIDKFRLYAAYKRWCKAPVSAEVSQEQYLKALVDELNRYRQGYKGSCEICRPVGHRNKLLRADLDESKERERKLWKIIEDKNEVLHRLQVLQPK